MKAVSSETPEYYNLSPGVEPLEFYYDLATFHGGVGRTEVEIYFGIPLEQLTGEEVEGRVLSRVEWTVALVDREGEEMHRGRDRLVFAGGTFGTEKGRFVPEVTSLRVPPGDYRLAVQLRDQISGKWGICQQEVEVPASLYQQLTDLAAR